MERWQAGLSSLNSASDGPTAADPSYVFRSCQAPHICRFLFHLFLSSLILLKQILHFNKSYTLIHYLLLILMLDISIYYYKTRNLSLVTLFLGQPIFVLFPRKIRLLFCV